MNIILYTTDCPKCLQLEKRMQQNNIKYNVCKDVDKMQELGIQSAPYLSINDKLYNFAQASKWATENKGELI